MKWWWIQLPWEQCGGCAFPSFPQKGEQLSRDVVPSKQLTHTWVNGFIHSQAEKAIRKQTAERLSNLHNIKDLVVGRILQLTISLVSGQCLSSKSIFLPLALIKRERATSHQAGFHQGYHSQMQICACLFLALLRTDQKERTRNKKSWLFLIGGKKYKNQKFVRHKRIPS